MRSLAQFRGVPRCFAPAHSTQCARNRDATSSNEALPSSTTTVSYCASSSTPLIWARCVALSSATSMRNGLPESTLVADPVVSCGSMVRDLPKPNAFFIEINKSEWVIGLLMVAFMLVSSTTIWSWSLIPGAVTHLSTRPGWEVKHRLRILSFRVGSRLHCSRL